MKEVCSKMRGARFAIYREEQARHDRKCAFENRWACFAAYRAHTTKPRTHVPVLHDQNGDENIRIAHVFEDLPHALRCSATILDPPELTKS
jgi:hypothetical protein